MNHEHVTSPLYEETEEYTRGRDTEFRNAAQILLDKNKDVFVCKFPDQEAADSDTGPSDRVIKLWNELHDLAKETDGVSSTVELRASPIPFEEWRNKNKDIKKYKEYF